LAGAVDVGAEIAWTVGALARGSWTRGAAAATDFARVRTCLGACVAAGAARRIDRVAAACGTTERTTARAAPDDACAATTGDGTGA
jgi:hypothetical protein